MKRLFIFICALFTFGTAYADDIVCDAGSYFNGTECEICPAGTYNPNIGATDSSACVQCPAGTYSTGGVSKCSTCRSTHPYSEPGATSMNECYDKRLRHYSGVTSCQTPDGCTHIECVCESEPAPCEYQVYLYAVKQGAKWTYSDGEIKEGCTKNPCQSSVVRAAYNDKDGSIYNPKSGRCEQCPSGATTPDGAANYGECTRILNYLEPGKTIPTKISLKLKQNTTPAFAVKINNDVFYGDMTPVDMATVPGLYVGYNNQKYRVMDNNFTANAMVLVSDSFIITTTPDTSSFGFTIIAYGEFAVDWGDGNVEYIDHSSTNYATYSHTYDVAAKRIIKLSGRATGYHRAKKGAKWVYHTLSFADNAQIAQINGSLGAVFPTLDDGTNPNFDSLFKDKINLTGQIPPNLFTGIVGSPANSIHSYMFRSVFEGCSGLTGEIPVGLFGNLSGAPGESTFVNAFQGCSGLTGAPAQNPDGTPLYDIEYDGQTWYEQSPGAFTDMYTDSGIDTSN